MSEYKPLYRLLCGSRGRNMVPTWEMHFRQREFSLTGGGGDIGRSYHPTFPFINFFFDFFDFLACAMIQPVFFSFFHSGTVGRSPIVVLYYWRRRGSNVSFLACLFSIHFYFHPSVFQHSHFEWAGRIFWKKWKKSFHDSSSFFFLNEESKISCPSRRVGVRRNGAKTFSRTMTMTRILHDK